MNSGPFSQTNISKRIAELPRLSTEDIRSLLDRAKGRNITELVEACSAELAARPISYDSSRAERNAKMSEIVQDKELADAIRLAFTHDRAASEAELFILNWIAEHPAGSYQDALRAYGKGDLSLVIGHLVYDRFGCFRKFMKPGETQSSVLLLKEDPDGKGVRYTLRPEALTVFKEVGIVR